jgi:NAD(P)-dependent dehydrogenase (short-subunit alcohol dehydrogenase family)
MKNALLVGNSDGIGLSLSRKLLQQGWSVRGVSRSPSPLDAPNYAHAVQNVRDRGYAADLAKVVNGDRLDLCVYCAGTGELFDRERIDCELTADHSSSRGATSARCARFSRPSGCARICLLR